MREKGSHIIAETVQKVFTLFKKKVHFGHKKGSLGSEKSSRAVAKKVHFVPKKCLEKKVHFMFRLKFHMSCARRFTWYFMCNCGKKVHLVPKKNSGKSSIHVPSESSHVMREKVHLVQKKNHVQLQKIYTAVESSLHIKRKFTAI